MSPMVVVLVGFGAGLMTMTIASLYKYVLKYWNEGFV
jgi:hypothetical protein